MTLTMSHEPGQDLNPTTLTAREIAGAVNTGVLTAEAVTRAFLDKIADRDPALGAFIHLDPDRAIGEARAVDAQGAQGPLAGVILGVKDVIDTADMPTAYGSKAYQGFTPAADAPCVALSRAAGAVAIGKTVSTEFAMGTPGKTVNPFDAARTPGGSSSGSAAALGAGLVNLAFGTQTSGSVIRPSAYCGIVGFKPTFGVVDRTGVKTLSDSLDTLGLMARNVGDAAWLAAVLSGRPRLAEIHFEAPPAFAVFETAMWGAVGPGTRLAMTRAVEALSARGATAPVVDVPDWWLPLNEAQDAVMGFEVLKALAYERLFIPDRIDARTRAFLAARERYDLALYEAGLASRDTALANLDALFAGADVLITPAAPDEAPLGLGATGDPSFNKAWTLLRMPAITVPAGMGPNGVPVGVQLVGRPGADRTVLAAAAFLEESLAA